MTPPQLLEFTTEWRARLMHTRHRGVLRCVGDAAWLAAVRTAFMDSDPASRAWYLGSGEAGGIAPREARVRLGQECDVLLVDALTGADPDALGILGGCVVAGGLMIWLVPPAWNESPVTDVPPGALNARLAVAGWEDSTIGRRLHRRLADLLGEASVLTVAEHDPVPDCLPDTLTPPTARPEGPSERFGQATLTPDQARAVEALCHVVRGQRRRPVVLRADRGRGKSAALGFAARKLFQEGVRRIVVTGPAREAIEPVFRHAEPIPAGAELLFRTPEALLVECPETELLLVDEAAAIATGVLTSLLAAYPRIAFATTVHGYEGTGRGFDLRFRAHLDTHTRGWRSVPMDAPIRWGEGDPLEGWLFRALLLDAEPAPAESVRDADPGNTELVALERDALVHNEHDLRAVFGLLVGAHYRTRPGDLHQLLDAPNMEVFALRHRGLVVAVALLSLEGGFADDLSDAIVAGLRRPHGHLLAEAIAVHCGFREGAAYRGARVQRIAVHPALRQRGLGTALLSGIAAALGGRAIDYLGASFGATPALLSFWFRNGFRPLRLGYRHNAASGEPSALVLAGLTPRGRDLACAAGDRFRPRFVRQLADVHRALDVALAETLLAAQGGGDVTMLTSRDWDDIDQFAHGRRAYEEVIVPLTQLAIAALTWKCPVPLAPQGREILIRRILQNQTWSQVSEACGLSGRRGVEAALRDVVATLRRRLQRR